MVVSILLKPALSLTLCLHYHFLPRTAMLHILNITKPQFMLSNILQVKMSIAYFPTQSPLQQYEYSIVYHVIMIMRPTQKQQKLPHQNAAKITAFCNANWGGQFSGAVKEGTPFELFKFCSLYGFLIFCSDGPIAWKSMHQNQTALSYCESKIMATNECITELQYLKHCASSIRIPETYARAKIYNDKNPFHGRLQ